MQSDEFIGLTVNPTILSSLSRVKSALQVRSLTCHAPGQPLVPTFSHDKEFYKYVVKKITDCYSLEPKKSMECTEYLNNTLSLSIVSCSKSKKKPLMS